MVDMNSNNRDLVPVGTACQCVQQYGRIEPAAECDNVATGGIGIIGERIERLQQCVRVEAQFSLNLPKPAKRCCRSASSWSIGMRSNSSM